MTKTTKYSLPLMQPSFPAILSSRNLYWNDSDHLGSSSWISDKDGNALQHLSYLPFGEVVANQKAQNSSFDTEYKFLGKELDAETGYIATDFRYYDPGLGVFLSIDPMASERSWVSPYSYCQNNPMNRIDPTGALDDEWEINKNGKVVNRIENKSEDSFHIVDDSGTRIEGKSIKFEYGTITGVNEPPVIIEGSPSTLTLFNVDGDNNAQSLFEFFADPNNTSVEWTHAKIGTVESGKNIVGTSHDNSSTAAGAYLRQTGYTIREENHNHPSGSYFPSKADRASAAAYKAKNRNIILNIYTYPNRYSEYDENGTLDFRDFGPEVEIFGN